MMKLNQTVKSLMAATSFFVMIGTVNPAMAEKNACQDPGWNQEWCAEIHNTEWIRTGDTDMNERTGDTDGEPARSNGQGETNTDDSEIRR